MKILHGVETLSREAGGLSVAVLGLTRALSEMDNSIVTRGAPLDTSTRPALVHQHGLWARVPVACGRFARRSGIPLVISPHGMLEPWAMARHAWRKRIAWIAYQRDNLRAAAVFHAASSLEAGHVRGMGFTQPIAVIPFGVDPISAAPPDPAGLSAPKSRRQVLFLSRLHPKKGLELLLKAWAAMDAPDWELTIAGNDENGYRSKLEALVRRLGLSDRVHFAGPLYGAAKDTAFRRADVFVLPSHSENFGFVIAEALNYGLPVIATTVTPWRHLPESGCGWSVDLEVEAIRDALGAAIALSDDERRAMGQKGAALVDRDHRWPGIVRRYLDVYRWLAGEAPRPSADWLWH